MSHTTSSTPVDNLDRQALIAFTQRLVRVPSVNQPELGRSEAAAVAVVAEQAAEFGWTVDVEEVAPGRPNAIIRVDGGLPGPTLLFEGHTDVVTEGDHADWTVDPFGGEIIEGKLYGRGSADMKGGVAAMMFATRALQLAGPFPGTIILAILCDEEEMMIGVHDFVAKGHADGVSGAIVCEPEAGEVCNVHKGAIRLRVDVAGTMSHGAMPHQGRNPIAAMSRFIERARQIEERLQAEHGDHPQLGLVYLTPTHIAAGSLPQLNVIPAPGLCTFDIRTIPGVDHAALLDELETVASSLGEELDVQFTLEALVDRAPTDTPVTDPVVIAVADAHRAVTGEEPVYGGVPGTTDGTILWRDANLPVVVYGPGGKWIAHQKDEFVTIDELVSAAEVYVEAAGRFLHAAP
ncbi:MAG: M20 family metallopeptidase [Acidimicrobiia bacterium]|nr:M20 family metallopeptidase [Acidimicrobiia bacterium]